MLNAIVPKFIKQIDKRLLLNSPLLWISKIHYIIYFTILLWVISFALGYVMPINLKDNFDIGIWHVLLTILSIVLLCVWIYKNAIFNIEKNYGNRSKWGEYKTFILYFICVGLILSFPLPFAMTYNWRVANTIATEELIKDINVLNIADPYLPDDSYKYETITDTAHTKQYVNFKKYKSFGSSTPYEYVNDTLTLKGLLSNYELEKQYKATTSKEAIVQIINQYKEVCLKYNVRCAINSEKQYETYKELCSSIKDVNQSSNFYELRTVKDDITTITRNIAEAKFNTLYIYENNFIRFMFYAIFYIVIFFMLFKNVQWQQYLITIVTLIVAPIILSILNVLFYTYNSGMFNISVLIIFISCLTITLTYGIKALRFNSFCNVCIQLCYLVIPVIPMYVVYLLEQYTDTFYRNYNNYLPSMGEAPLLNNDNLKSVETIYNSLLREYGYQTYLTWLHALEIAGILGFVIIGVPLLKEVFVKQLALPRNS